MKNYFVEFPLSNKCRAITTTTDLGNMAYQVDDGRDVRKHRLLLADILNVDANKFTYVHQHHSDKVMKATINEIGRGQNNFEDGLECDALYTYEKELPYVSFMLIASLFFSLMKKLR